MIVTSSRLLCGPSIYSLSNSTADSWKRDCYPGWIISIWVSVVLSFWIAQWSHKLKCRKSQCISSNRRQTCQVSLLFPGTQLVRHPTREEISYGKPKLIYNVSTQKMCTTNGWICSSSTRKTSTFYKIRSPMMVGSYSLRTPFLSKLHRKLLYFCRRSNYMYMPG